MKKIVIIDLLSLTRILTSGSHQTNRSHNLNKYTFAKVVNLSAIIKQINVEVSEIVRQIQLSPL
jgi:hypothetical protein